MSLVCSSISLNDLDVTDCYSRDSAIVSTKPQNLSMITEFFIFPPRIHIFTGKYPQYCLFFLHIFILIFQRTTAEKIWLNV